MWKACERFKILPEGVQPRWEDNTPFTQAKLLAFDQTRSHDEYERMASLIPRLT